MIPFRFLPNVEGELDDVVSHYEEAQTGLGIEFLAAAAHVIERARRLPQAGTRITGLSSAFEVRRYLLTRFPYKLIGVVRSDELIFVALSHQSQHPYYWRPRLAKVQP